jgi:hypothetical protein
VASLPLCSLHLVFVVADVWYTLGRIVFCSRSLLAASFMRLCRWKCFLLRGEALVHMASLPLCSLPPCFVGRGCVDVCSQARVCYTLGSLACCCSSCCTVSLLRLCRWSVFVYWGGGTLVRMASLPLCSVYPEVSVAVLWAFVLWLGCGMFPDRQIPHNSRVQNSGVYCVHWVRISMGD